MSGLKPPSPEPGDAPPRRRCFIAVPLPDGLKQHLEAWQQELRDSVDNVRWTRAENLHITLRFLGPQPEDFLEKLGNSMLSVGRLIRPFEVCCRGVSAFPSPRKARVVWAGLNPDNSWALLDRQLTRQLERCGVAKERRAFTPHLTLGRVRGQSLDLSRQLTLFDNRESRPFPIDRIVLYESRLRPGGALHLPLTTVRLTGDDISCHTMS